MVSTICLLLIEEPRKAVCDIDMLQISACHVRIASEAHFKSQTSTCRRPYPRVKTAPVNVACGPSLLENACVAIDGADREFANIDGFEIPVKTAD